MKAYTYGQRDLELPRILGHEIAGTVVDLGEGVSQVKTGERVQIAPGIPCGCCSYCLMGMHHMCDSVQIFGFHYDGGFAEYVLIPATGVSNGILNKIPDHISFQEATFTEPLACSINMQDALQVGIGDTVVIFGAGPLGILNAKLARKQGAGPIILLEINESRLAYASRQDFDYCINPLHDDPAQKVLEITCGKGADVVIPCCPDPNTFQSGLVMLGKRGRFGFFSGLITDSPALEADFNLIHYKELSVHGAYGCSTYHTRKALELISTGKVTVKDLITLNISLEDALLGLEKVRNSEEIKIMINY